METTNKLIYSKEKLFNENGEEYRIRVTVSLDDDCKNNICDWGITANVDMKCSNGRYKNIMAGCLHEEIKEHCPELAKFIPLHLSNHYGMPMYPLENGMYFIKEGNKSTAMKVLRISEEEYNKLSEAVDDDLYFKYLLFNIGIVDRWKRESDELIVELEKLCNKKWVNLYGPDKERSVIKITQDEILVIETRIEDGYYTIENIQKRKKEKHENEISKERKKITDECDLEIKKAETKKEVMLCVLDYGLPVKNVIYHNDKNELVFNFSCYRDKINKKQFDDFVKNVDMSKLPEGIKITIGYE